MRLVRLNARQALLLRENLTGNKEGYDYVDLCRLDKLATRITELQGEYADRMAELVRQEKRLLRQQVREQLPAAEAEKALARLRFDVEDLLDEMAAAAVELRVSDADHKLIADKLDAVERWSGSDQYRAAVLGMLTAVREAESDDTAADSNGREPAEVTPLRRR